MKDLLNFFDKPQSSASFQGIQVALSSPEKIKEWSFGEVKKPETINYRTFKPEKDGLFCAKIFGPIKDYECLCGKYKRMKYRGVVCEKCGVEVTKAKVRRERMGHIELASPVAHIWLLRSLPSRIGAVLGMTLKEVEKVLYCESYAVVDPMETSLKEGTVLSEDEFQSAQEEYGPHFEVSIGGEAILNLLKKIDVEYLSKKLRIELKEATSEMAKKKLSKRLKVIDSFKRSKNKPEWMILTCLPLIPPDLRPLVHLDGGRFATSDLNDLYRRVINRNNRLKKLQELNAPDIIIRNEKRMLQESVDALLDNGRGGKVFTGSNKRPLRSLSDALKGKQGRFRGNLLGKRVDYSGRSVIVVGPHLRLHQCGLPKKMALELFKPFIYGQLERRGITANVKQAKKMVEEEHDIVWDVLSQVVKEHPVLLNRAPTLHRLGIQAFEPLLHEGKAIQLHPLVCAAFNADFDGDTMSVHVPLSIEAQVEARVLMMSTNNILSPANGRPIINPTQDIVLGLYWITRIRPNVIGEGRVFGSVEEVIYNYDSRLVDIQAAIKVKIGDKIEDSSVGRVILASRVPGELPFSVMNKVMTKKALAEVIDYCFRFVSGKATVLLADAFMQTGFEYSTRAGISIGIDDLTIPSEKNLIIAEAEKEIQTIQKQYDEGLTTESERYNKAIDIWSEVTDKVAQVMMNRLETEKITIDGKSKSYPSFNSIYVMADSGARGSVDQMKQLSGMRGLLAKPSGEIIETPITANYREGLSVTQYFIATHGARKGSADTALKTANSGYLTRRLVDVAQDVIVSQVDCGTTEGIVVSDLLEGGEVLIDVCERVLGRIALKPVVDPYTGDAIVEANEEITEASIHKIKEFGINKIWMRSSLMCRAKKGVCVKCYGRDLARGRVVNLGEAVGIIAAQSIGEPGTQLTMRTFHLGGAASRDVEESKYTADYDGIVKFENLQAVWNKDGKQTVMTRNSHILIVDETGRERSRLKLTYGTILEVKEDASVKKGTVLATWDPYSNLIVSDVSGRVQYDGLDAQTFSEKLDSVTGFTTKEVIRSKDLQGKSPVLYILDSKGEKIKMDKKDVPYQYALPEGAQILASDNQEVHAGDVLAKIYRESRITKDITGGLPRVEEIFEARCPKDPAVITEVDGEVSFGSDVRGKQRVIITPEDGKSVEYLIEKGKHIIVRAGEYLQKGEKLVEGDVNPHDQLKVSDVVSITAHLLGEVQKVYRLQGVSINDKHIEIILKQMVSKVEVSSIGDTDFVLEDLVNKRDFEEANEKVVADEGEPAKARPVLLGITKTSLSTESWLSAASFQEVTKVLTEAAINSKVDYLHGLKENIVMGRLIPAGTGVPCYSQWPVGVVEPPNKDTGSIVGGMPEADVANSVEAGELAEKRLGLD